MNARQLKNSLLQLAVQGKLVPQDPHDEPASVLLERIAQERERLMKKKKIKKPKSTSRIYRRDGHFYESINGGEPVCIDDQIPFDIPDSWEWVRYSQLITLSSGQDLSPNKYNDKRKGIPYITGASNFDKGAIIFNRWTEEPKTIAERGYILLTCKGTIGELAILNEKQVHIARQIMGIRPVCSFLQNYLLLILKFNMQLFKTKAQGLIPGISRDVVLETIIPLPPLAEQERIVQKVEKILPYVEEYGKHEEELSALNKAFPQALKKSLLQWAIQGKLVPQDPSDEPASVLLKHIAAEKEKFIQEGKIKKPKSTSRILRRGGHFYESINGGEPVCIDDQIPFEIPDSWEWTRLGYVFSLFSTGPFGSMVHKSDYTDSLSGIPLINPTNIKNGCISRDALQRVRKEKSESLASYRLSEGDIIIARRGDLSKCAIVTKKEEQWLCGTGSFFLHLSFIVSEYFCYFYASSYTQSMLLGESVGTTMVNLNQRLLNDLLFPLPPLQEQRRICDRLDKLLNTLKG